jgi:hypothetical protein
LYYLSRAGDRWGDGDGDVVDCGEGLGWVVVGGAAPGGVWAGGCYLVDFVDVYMHRHRCWGSAGRVPVLVCPPVWSARRSGRLAIQPRAEGADEALAAVVGDEDGAALTEGSLEGTPGRWEGDGVHGRGA